jgi:hypothetical protein
MAALLATTILGTDDLLLGGSARRRRTVVTGALLSVGLTAYLYNEGTLDYWYQLPRSPRVAPTLADCEFRALDLSDVRTVGLIQPKVTRHVRLSAAGAGLYCAVVAGEATSSGGVRLPVSAPVAFRVEATLFDPRDIDAVHVQAVDQERRWRWRWAWRLGPACPGTSERVAYTFVPGQPVGYFEANTRPDAGEVVELHIFLRLKPGRKPSFVLHKVEIGRSAHEPTATGEVEQ